MESTVYDWDQIAAEPTRTGLKRRFIRAQTGTLDQLTCHVTTLNPGQQAHEPHRHPEEEMIIVKEGSLMALIEGKSQLMGAGSIFLIAPQDLHGVSNAGASPATYFVIKWWSPGMLAAAEARPSPGR